MTPSFDRWARKNHGISGKKLLAKVAAAEGGGTTQRPNVSSAGARGPFQFIPSTRAAYKKKYGLDAWRTNTEAAKAAMIHLKGTGIKGYNPGMPSYTRLVLGQDVDTGPLKGKGKHGSKKVDSYSTKKTTRTPGVDNSAIRTEFKRAYLANRHHPDALLNLAAGLEGAKDVPGKTTTKVVRKKGRKATVKGGGGTGKQQARRIVEQAGKGYIGSRERTPAQNRATGGAVNSDHLTTKRNASAGDLKYGTGRKVAKRLGIKGWKPGTYQRYNVRLKGKRYSVQILENVKGHYDHTHVGIQALGK